MLLHKQWLCSPECLGQVLEELLSRLIESSRPAQQNKAHRFPLGLLMLSLGWISNESLQSALNAQREAGKGRVGDWLRRQGVVTEPQVTRAVAMQWSLPVFPLEKWDGSLVWAHLLPFPLLEYCQMLPVHCAPASGRLHLAFSNRVDYTALYAIEQMLDFRTEPCLAQQSYIERALARLHQECRSADTFIEGPIEPALISRITLQQALNLRAQEIRVVSCSNNIWVRLLAPNGTHDLLFRPAPECSIPAPAPSTLVANWPLASSSGVMPLRQ
jgi:hypothetical protein